MAIITLFFVHNIEAYNQTLSEYHTLESGEPAKHFVLAATMNVTDDGANFTLKGYLTTLSQGNGLPDDHFEIDGVHEHPLTYHKGEPDFIYNQEVLIDHVSNVIMEMYFDPTYLWQEYGIKIDETNAHVFDGDEAGDFTFEVK